MDYVIKVLHPHAVVGMDYVIKETHANALGFSPCKNGVMCSGNLQDKLNEINTNSSPTISCEVVMNSQHGE